MLKSLHIENVAVIKQLDLDLSVGLTALTGETGAGKSIIIDCINLILGAKADKELIRTGEQLATVSAVFSSLSPSTLTALRENGIDCDDDFELMIQRSVAIDGRSSLKLNGKSFSLTVLRNIAPSLINIHGQSDTYAITDAKAQLEIIDLYAHNQDLLREYTVLYSRFCEIRSRIAEVQAKEAERERLSEILEYQIKDIDSLGLTAGEEELLLDKKIKIKGVQPP